MIIYSPKAVAQDLANNPNWIGMCSAFQIVTQAFNKIYLQISAKSTEMMTVKRTGTNTMEGPATSWSVWFYLDKDDQGSEKSQLIEFDSTVELHSKNMSATAANPVTFRSILWVVFSVVPIAVWAVKKHSSYNGVE